MTHGSGDLTPSVQNGLAYYYAIVGLGNIGYGLWQQLRLKKATQAFVWYAVGAFFLVLSIVNFAHLPLELPSWFKDLSDQGVQRAFVTLGITGGLSTAVYYVLLAALIVVAVATAGDLLYTFYLKKNNGNGNGNGNGGTSSWANRFVGCSLLLSILGLLLYGTNAITYFVVSIAGFMALIVWRQKLTEPHIAWGIFNAGLLFGGLSMTDANFRSIIVKPDNVPIVGLIFVVGFFTWLALRKAVINDRRLSEGLPPTEKEEDDKVLVWPDLVYTELICMIVVTAVLIVWAVALPAPLEQPASSTKTPNPSKAPWYFLGLQEMLVYYDPWMAGVVLPTFIILGLIAIPYIDFNQKGNGYYTFNERPYSIITFLVGFLVLWVTLIILGTFLRGPNWNFFGLYEVWDAHKLVPLNNVNLSDYFWLRNGIYPVVWETSDPTSLSGLFTIFMRELPGIVLVVGYLLFLPPLLARTVFRGMFIKMGFIRYITMATLLLFMACLPIKMVLRWTINLKYIVAVPEFFFNI